MNKPKHDTEEAVKIALDYRHYCYWTIGVSPDGNKSADVTVQAVCNRSFGFYSAGQVVCVVSLRRFVEKRNPLTGVWAKLRSLIRGKKTT